MATDSKPSFDSIIQAGRKKRQNEELANRLLGNGRRASAPTVLTGRRGTPTGASTLASKGGIVKSQNNGPSKFPTTFKTPHSIPARGPRADTMLNRTTSNSQLERKAKLLAGALGGSGGRDSPAVSGLRKQVNLRDAPSRAKVDATNGNIMVRGMGGGPFTVIAQNFAPGTTAADIETVLVPDKDLAGFLSCRLLSSDPTVIAELVVAHREAAEMVINKYNNKKADGRLLHVWLKDKAPSYNRVTKAPLGIKDAAKQPLGVLQNPNRLREIQSSDNTSHQTNAGADDDYMEVELAEDGYATSNHSRQSQGYNDNPNLGYTGKAEPDLQDGTHGFPEPPNQFERQAPQQQQNKQREQQQPLYQDQRRTQQPSNNRQNYDRSYDRYAYGGRDADRGYGGRGMESDRLQSRQNGGSHTYNYQRQNDGYGRRGGGVPRHGW